MPTITFETKFSMGDRVRATYRRGGRYEGSVVAYRIDAAVARIVVLWDHVSYALPYREEDLELLTDKSVSRSAPETGAK